MTVEKQQKYAAARTGDHPASPWGVRLEGGAFVAWCGQDGDLAAKIADALNAQEVLAGGHFHAVQMGGDWAVRTTGDGTFVCDCAGSQALAFLVATRLNTWVEAGKILTEHLTQLHALRLVKRWLDMAPSTPDSPLPSLDEVHRVVNEALALTQKET